MTDSTLQISGLSSGFDWRSMIDQLMQVEHRSVDLIENKKSGYEAQLREWQSFNSLLQAMNVAVQDLKDPESFDLFSSSMSSDNVDYAASSLLSVSTSTSASLGTYNIKISNLATAQKLSSNPFTSQTEALGSSYAGDIVINGQAITINETDSLLYVADVINNANTGANPTGVTASVINYGVNDYRLILTSDQTGADGINILNGSSVDLVQRFGWKDNETAVIKNEITGGAQSDLFATPNTSIQSLIGLSNAEASSGTLSIGGTSVSIDLATMSLNDIKNEINNAAITGVSASVISKEIDGDTYYRLQIDGTQTFVDENNILNTLGILDHTSIDVSGVVSANAMTINGTAISSNSLLTDIDGYNLYTAGDKITLTGTDTSGSDIGSVDVNILSTTTIQDLLDQIESSYGNVIAYVTSNGTIQVDDLSSGDSLAVTLTSTIQDGNSQLDFGAFGAAAARKREITAGNDAIVEIDGVSISRSTNIIDDVIEGVTLNLQAENDSTNITLNIERDLGTIQSNIQAFVNKYNQAMSYINSQFTYDAEAEQTGGILFGDSTLRSVKNDLTTLISKTFWGLSDSYSSLALVGIENQLNEDNQLELHLNESTLEGYLQTNFNDIVALFTAQGTPSDSQVTYISHSQNTQAGEYEIHIDQAATQGTVTGSVDLSAGGFTETLTVTQGENSALISITSDMSMNDIINEINNELDTTYTQTLVGDEQLYSDSGQSNAIGSGTTWENIYNSLGTQLQFNNGDAISFTGTTRLGKEVSGSYQIDDITSDTVQDLLSAIEAAYSSQVTATIDTSGRIVLQDINSGDSQLSLTSVSHSIEGEFFGTVDITEGAGDGSLTGRYTIDITASIDGSNHLVLTSDDFGSSSSFSISQTTSELGLLDGDYAGLDVSGTIDGEEATGSGQLLQGLSGNTNTDGLSILYRGTDNNVDVGTIKVTIGAAEEMDRILFNITDSIDGYVSFKETSLQNKISDISQKIIEMEERLDKKMQRLINQYISMELTISQLQSQSNWLTSQINALFGV